MLEISAKEARRRFSELLDRCQQGEEIVITRRGSVVAHWLPPSRPRRPLPDMRRLRRSLGEPATPFAQLQREERERR